MPRSFANRQTNRPSGQAADRKIDIHTLSSLVEADRRSPGGGRDQKVIAFCAASPGGTSPLRQGDECAGIMRELQLAEHRHDFRVEQLWATTSDDLLRFLTVVDPAIVHISGHGNHASLALQDERGLAELVSPRALAMMIGVAAPSARLVMLNVCSSTAHAEALRHKVDAVVAMDGKITDDGARMFASRFYGALGHRRCVGNAFDQGIARLAAKGLCDETLPRCVTRDGIDAYQLAVSP